LPRVSWGSRPRIRIERSSSAGLQTSEPSAAVGAEHPARLDLLAALEHDAADWVLVGAGAEQAGDLLTEAGHGHAVESADRGEPAHGLVAEGADRVLGQVDPMPRFDPLQRSQLGQARQGVREQGVGREGVGWRRLAVEEQDLPALLR
jgi:hypothetical protein